MPVTINFSNWLLHNEGFYVFENVKPLGNKIKSDALANLIKNSNIRKEDTEELEIFKKKAEKLISDFEQIRNYDNKWWMSPPRVQQGQNAPGMNDPVLSTKIYPEIKPEERMNLQKYTNIKQLQAVVDHAFNVIMFPKDLNKSMKKMLAKRFVDNSVEKVITQDSPEGKLVPQITEDQATALLNRFEIHRKYYNYDNWKDFLLQKSEDDESAMGDDFSLGNKEKGIPDIPHDQRFNLNNYNYYNQLEKLVDKLDTTNLLGMARQINQDDDNITDEQKNIKLEKSWKIQKNLLKNIKVAYEDDEYIIYQPKSPSEAILIKDAEPSATDYKAAGKIPACPSWCICYRNTDNMYNSYRYGSGLTFYIIKNKTIYNISKMPMTKDREYEFFVLGAYPDRDVFQVTKQPNDSDPTMNITQLLDKNPKMKKYLDLKIFKSIPLNQIEKTLKNTYERNITAEQFNNLKTKEVFFEKDKEITDPEKISVLQNSKELPPNIERREIDQKEMFLSICGINNDIKSDVFRLFTEDQQRRYVGYNKFINGGIIDYILELADQGKDTLAKRHFTIASRLLEETEDRNLHYLDSNLSYAKLFARYFDKLSVESIGRLSKKVIGAIYLSIPNRQVWFEKFSIEKNDTNSILQKFDDSAKFGWLKGEITAVGLEKTFNDPIYVNILKSAAAEPLANFLKEYKLKDIAKYIPLLDLRAENSRDWNTILQFQSFNEIMELVPKQIVENLDKNTIITSYLSGDAASARTIKDYFKSKFGDAFISGAYPNPNEKPDILIQYYRMNDERFKESVTPQFMSDISAKTLNYLLDSLQEKRSSFANFYFDYSNKFASGITSKLISSSNEPLQMAEKIIKKFNAENIPIEMVNEILQTVINPQESKKVFEILKMYHDKLSGDDIIDLISKHGPKHVYNNVGRDIYLRHEIEDTDKPLSNKFADLHDELKKQFENLPIEDFMKKDFEDAAADAYNGYVSNLMQKYKVKDLKDANLQPEEKERLLKLKQNIEDARRAEDDVDKYNSYLQSVTKDGKKVDELPDEIKEKLIQLKKAANVSRIQSFYRLAKNPVARRNQPNAWLPANYSVDQFNYVIKNLLNNPDLQLNYKFINSMIKSTRLANFEQTWLALKRQNPKNFDHIKNMTADQINSEFGQLFILKAATPRLFDSLLEVFGIDKIKGMIEIIYKRLTATDPLLWGSIAKNILDYANKANKYYKNKYFNFITEILDEMAGRLNLPKLKDRVTPEVYANMEQAKN